MKGNYIIYAVLLLFMGSCQDDDNVFGPVQAPTNLTISIEVANDQTGNVSVTPSAEKAINFHIIFVEGEDPVVINNGETAAYRYTQSGQYSQVITVIAYGTGGASSSQSVQIDLDVRLIINPEVLASIAGQAGQGKRWVWDSSNAGHFGVGDPMQNFPDFFSATPNQLDPCLYDDVLVFSHDGQDNYSFQLETQSATYINWAEIKRFFPDAAPQQFVDECREIDDQIETDTNFVILEDNSGRLTLTVNNSTMSYWSGATSYEITELTDNKLVVRGIQDPFDPPGDMLAWYHTFVPEGSGGGTTCDSGATGAAGSGNNDVLVWAEEFDTDGAPCDGNWSYDVGTGNNGWGNEEVQYYTDRAENIIVENGVLKITAKAESFAGQEYTSARINSKDKFEFEYGRVEARAKLPTGGGTWPAMWMLGADFETNPWPAAGEIDFMEHVGNDQDVIFSSLHWPANFGANAITESTVVPGASDEFHIYEVIWNPQQIIFSVDGVVYHVFQNNANYPFNKDFFLILNVAMGGTFGGTIDPGFVESTMEIDYVRVYQ
jgi:hypothetical protein